ncbi:hypothetical protein BS50DRAFT_56907 [Corynespora cassiicola Philippines]|uniref:Uncharacterized protein n=1 Tax=Corynespora cassiicola Philippines TaxID=1448308 RepID=A0A2T2NJ32_CORCC|nr:hypothetical protein BS50DRAFT_56907 [Corynespora cassiicola Philippines]
MKQAVTAGGGGRFTSANPSDKLSPASGDEYSLGSTVTTKSPTSAGSSDSSNGTIGPVCSPLKSIHGYSTGSPIKGRAGQGGLTSPQISRQPGCIPSQTTRLPGIGPPQATPQSSYASPQGTAPLLARRYSNAGSTRGGVMLQPTFASDGPVPQTMFAVPEEAAVQEFAFRRGQQDRGNPRDRVPHNPFASHFDKVWVKYYLDGKNSTLENKKPLSVSSSPTGANFNWAPLINPYTQDAEHPKGSFDEEYSHGLCESALKGMSHQISLVCKRGKEWDRYVCEIPSPVAQALQHFPELLVRYRSLQRDAREALGGGRPYGY